MSTRPLSAPLLDAALVGISLLDVWAHVDASEPLRMACALAASFALLPRRRLPLLTFLLTLPSVLLSDAVFAALAALYTLASLTRRRTLLAVCAVAFTLSDMTSLPSPDFDFSTPSTFVTLGYTAATAAAPVFLGQLVQARRDLSLRLAEISRARDHERQLTAQTVLAKERTALAREMHDVVSHQVSLIAVQAGVLQVGSRDADVRQAAATIRRLSVQTLDELRHMVSVLRASGGRPTELIPQPSLADIPQLVDNSGIEAELHTDLSGSLPPPVQRAIYRTIQEALTNVRKHAPGAKATVRVRHEDTTVRVTVTNTAPTRPALPLPSAHYGLVGLRQRAELLGGTVTCGPTADGGYQLCLELPADGGEQRVWP
ncbi:MULTISPECIES: sensor histidine kinase [Streptomyces]|uniref:histidine kinase n=1 Tax=Streptomyces viridosporus (strain ATCC 14672 / DSM 40746 / JCM 4963 / KCTC 9882 / NRRL B-12104 / FH 1290) TaxID=566461 RepID=D6A445_STRV1|nr:MULTISPECIES: histidine kinase [Streptomyces]EFE71599.1 two-component system sensor kinase [Streptomyces viridosporus ATCC 14672]PWJ08011.1 two-component sensor histidine kinase [Streptomyces sp. NWU49]